MSANHHKSPKASPRIHHPVNTHPLTKNAWKGLYDAFKPIIAAIEADCRYLDDIVAANLHDGIEDTALEKKADLASRLFNEMTQAEDTLYQIMYPELTETPKEGMGKYE